MFMKNKCELINQIGLNSYNSHDPYGDNDGDGLSNLFEYNHSLNMNDPDTDHDGIDDGAEYHYWQ